MFMMKGALMLFISLAIGYAVCVSAKKQEGALKTLGYTLGTAIIVLSLLYGVLESGTIICMKGEDWRGHKAMKCPAGTFMKGRLK